MAELKHIAAFEAYYEMGDTRSYEKLSKELKTSVKTIEKWASKERWQEEVKLRNYDLVRANRDANLLAKQKEATDFKKITSALLGQYVEKIKKEQIKLESVQDLERLCNILGKVNGWLDGAGCFADSAIGIAEGVGTQPAGVNDNADTSPPDLIFKEYGE
jgi:hypothetical protein